MLQIFSQVHLKRKQRMTNHNGLTFINTSPQSPFVRIFLQQRRIRRVDGFNFSDVRIVGSLLRETSGCASYVMRRSISSFVW